MWRNYLKVALKLFRKYWLHSFINIAGLSIGLLVGLIIFLHVVDEYSYDKFNSRSNSIYRITHIRNTSNSVTTSATTPLALAPYIQQEFSNVTQVTRILRDSYGLLQFEDARYNEPNFAFADSSIVSLFDFIWVHGHPSQALARPDGLLLSKRNAAKLFGDENPIGKTVHYRNWGQEMIYHITGVFDLPANSHFHFDAIAPFESQHNLWNAMHGTDWFYTGGWTYVEIPAASEVGNVRSQLTDLIQRHLPDDLKAVTTFDLQPLLDIHLNSSLAGEIEPNGSLQYLYLQITIGALIILIACTNFVNITIARSATRLKEVAIRKSYGGGKIELIAQFILETVLYIVASIIVSILLLPFALPVFNSIIGRDLSMGEVLNPQIIIVMTMVILLIILISSVYPAFRVSGFGSSFFLKSSTDQVAGKNVVQKFLVTGQFVGLIVLMIGSLAVNRQMTFMKNKDLGFKVEEIAYVDGYDIQALEALKNDIRQVEGVTHMAVGNGIPGSTNAPMELSLATLEGMNENERIELYRGSGDSEFLELLDLEFIMGGNFSKTQSDSLAPIIVNQALLQNLPWKEDPIGRKIELFNMLGRSMGVRRIVGVVGDFHMESLHNRIRPAVFTHTERAYNVLIRFQTDHVDRLRDEIVTILNKYRGNFAGDFYFLRSDLNAQYQNEERFSHITFWLTAIAMIIAVIGVFGLASFAAQQRIKEMSIRSVLGASVFHLAATFSKSFLLYAFVAIGIGLPIAYYFCLRWLEGFAYHDSISPGIFAISAAILLTMVIMVITYHALKVISVNPATTLRNE